MNRSRLAVSLILVGMGFLAASVRADEVGSLKIRAVFKGDADKYKMHKVQAIADTECAQYNPILTEDVQINRADDPMTLKNVVVWIKSGPIDFRDPSPSVPVRVNVSQCQIVPHIVTVREGQPIFIVNQDPMKHRLQLKRTIDKEFAVTLPKQGMQISLTMEAEENPVPLVSTSYVWMQAWIAAFEHPYFATTGNDGVVRFSAFPPGDYEIEAWHEKFGRQSATATVKANEIAEVDFVFEPKDASAKKPAEPAGN